MCHTGTINGWIIYSQRRASSASARVALFEVDSANCLAAPLPCPGPSRNRGHTQPNTVPSTTGSQFPAPRAPAPRSIPCLLESQDGLVLTACPVTRQRSIQHGLPVARHTLHCCRHSSLHPDRRDRVACARLDANAHCLRRAACTRHTVSARPSSARSGLPSCTPLRSTATRRVPAGTARPYRSETCSARTSSLPCLHSSTPNRPPIASWGRVRQDAECNKC